MTQLAVSKTRNTKLREAFWVWALLSLVTLAKPCVAAPTPALHVCINLKTGATTAKAKCTAAKEVPLTPQTIRNFGGNGFSVYDSTGSVIGPLIGIGETVVTIGTKKYWATFTENSFGVPLIEIFFSGSNCTGTAYTTDAPSDSFSAESAFVQYSGMGTLGVDDNGQLWVTSGPILNGISYSSYQHYGSCYEGLLNNIPTISSVHQVLQVGSLIGNIVPPIDVH